ncbi:MAG: hypothetical protein HN778_14470 [Prolixibacteraceae bacterium]|jgi:ADP-ribosylglycohydrolase|nr:hypothetical protein [Prolixibacteraceae bacterium]MBT6766974.1 hypothetical protein [Prolixibacteraceae bacterium]MBT6997958.1 hypothetical protein [Prolixibacteraceae bacterium]MBT7396032.1 hypothetical protein [Prolixibacteraceae bacterium]
MRRFNIHLFHVTIGLFGFLHFTNLHAQKPVVAIFANDEKAKENSDSGEFWIIQLDEPSPNLTVKIKIEGTASDGLDYRCFSDTWKVNKRKTFKVLPINDGILEGDETVKITILESPDYDIEEIHKSATVTIQDNSLPDVEFLTPSSVGKEARSNVDIKVALSKAFIKEIELDYSVQGVVAEQNTDFKLNSGTLIIPAGKTEASINLKVIDDNEAEGDETVVIRLHNAKNANIETQHAHYYTIQNDDGVYTESVVYDRIYGALLGFRAGCSMGAVTEFNWDQQRSKATFGLLEDFKPFVHYGDSWTHPAGATEDGGERHKLLCTAIIEKQDRINYQDMKNVWLRDCEIENMRHMTQNYDRVLLSFAKWGVPPADFPITKYGKPRDLGEHIHLTARTFQALPCINAGDPENAIFDMNEMGKLYYEDPNDLAFAWGAVYNAAMALAMLPDATVESVIEGALKYATPEIEEELRYVMSVSEKYEDPMNREMWQELTDIYMDPESKYNAFARIEKYPNSSIFENVGFAFALFKATNANVRQSVIIATNRGYDTDCTAASAAALCGALSGTSTIPKDWVKTLDSGIANNPYTNSHFTNKATADGLYLALQSKVKRMEKEAASMKKNSEEAKKINAYLKVMREADVLK